MARSLLLNENWDICLDQTGGIAMTDGEGGEAYAVAQNVANAVRLFTDDAYFDTERGIPHFDSTFNLDVSMSVIGSLIRQAAMDVEGVEDADVELDDVENRVLTGTIELTLTNGETANVQF